MFKKIIKFFEMLISRKIVGKIQERGSNVILSYPITITKPEKLKLGNDIYIGPNSWFSTYGNVVILDGTIIGPNIKVYTGNHNYDSETYIPYDEVTIAKNVIIKENVWIGGDVTILPGVTIEEGAIVGACSVVTKSVPKGAIVGGNPAKIIKYRDIQKYDSLKNEHKIYLSEKRKGKLKMIIRNDEDNF